MQGISKADRWHAGLGRFYDAEISKGAWVWQTGHKIIKRQLIIGDSKISNSRGRSTRRGANILFTRVMWKKKVVICFFRATNSLLERETLKKQCLLSTKWQRLELKTSIAAVSISPLTSTNAGVGVGGDKCFLKKKSPQSVFASRLQQTSKKERYRIQFIQEIFGDAELPGRKCRS